MYIFFIFSLKKAQKHKQKKKTFRVGGTPAAL